MRVLVADRNAMLLEAISRTFAHRFSIQTATSRERCDALLRQGGFDLAVISERLADAPGLDLLGQIARDSPGTRRVFCARRSRLQLLRGKLGAFGLFRTLAYPIAAQEFLATLVLARAGLEIDAPVLETHTVPVARPRARELSAKRANISSARNPALELHRHARRSQTAAMPHAVPPVIRPPPLAGAGGIRNTARVRQGSMCAKVLLGGAVVGAFLLTLTLAGPHEGFYDGSDPVSPVEMQQRDLSGPSRGSKPLRSSPVFRPSLSLARGFEARPVPRQARVKPVVPQVAASTSPIADPSTFGSEAYEPIYSE